MRIAREHAGLTQQELADRLGVAVTTVRRTEWGEGHPRLERVTAWAAACDVSAEWLQWNVDACGQADMQLDLRPADADGGRGSYTPSDSNREPIDYTHRFWAIVRETFPQADRMDRCTNAKRSQTLSTISPGPGWTSLARSASTGSLTGSRNSSRADADLAACGARAHDE